MQQILRSTVLLALLASFGCSRNPSVSMQGKPCSSAVTQLGEISALHVRVYMAIGRRLTRALDLHQDGSVQESRIAARNAWVPARGTITTAQFDRLAALVTERAARGPIPTSVMVDAPEVVLIAASSTGCWFQRLTESGQFGNLEDILNQTEDAIQWMEVKE